MLVCACAVQDSHPGDSVLHPQHCAAVVCEAASLPQLLLHLVRHAAGAGGLLHRIPWCSHIADQHAYLCDGTCCTGYISSYIKKQRQYSKASLCTSCGAQQRRLALCLRLWRRVQPSPGPSLPSQCCIWMQTRPSCRHALSFIVNISLEQGCPLGFK